MSSEGPSVVIFTAQSRLQSYQQVAFVEHILAVARQVMYLVGDSLVLYISCAPLEFLAVARSQTCLQKKRLPMLFSLPCVCDDCCDYDTLSVLLAVESVSLCLDNPANMEFNHKDNLSPIWQLFLIVPQVNINIAC